MGIEHNYMAHEVSAILLEQLRAGAAGAWATPRLSTKSTLWQGFADWPRPDIAFEDRTSSASFAIEFKPPNQPKREYVTGLGQAITYLSSFEYSGLVVPTLSWDGFEIADYLRDVLARDLPTSPIALFGYDKDPAQLAVLRRLKLRKKPATKIPSGIGRKVFWAYWRDLSNFDVFELLKLLDQHDGQPFEKVFSIFWKRFMVTGRSLTWEGSRRKKKTNNIKSKNSESLNAKLALRYSGLLSVDERLTAAGHELLRVGKVYTPGASAFLDVLAGLILKEGRHLDLIFWVDEQNRLIPSRDMKSSDRYFDSLDNALVAAGVIAARNPRAAKPHFIRDEPKLWNKLGLLVRDGNIRYFHRNYGLAFNWRRIISVLEGSSANQ